MEMRSESAVVACVTGEFDKALAEYRRAVSEGDGQGDLNLRTGFKVMVVATKYAGGMCQVVCDHHGEPVRVLVSLTSDAPWRDDQQAYAVMLRDPDDPAVWLPEQRVYYGSPRTEPVAVWTDPER